MADGGITALLGPTNTGKTHRAIERMLEYETGMIGLPLRLLAREVYDRVSARVGESRVALVTGEEQRVPPRPAYWIATVEAMPTEIEVDFVAIDEIQLAAHDQRGHVFTSRVLSARGRKETWLLGSDTMRSALRELVPTARPVDHPRLSRLAYAGPSTLSRLPERSAVVAFSMPHVYEIADRIRARRGGAAVVTGALSPRTRNAQVAMFQAGEVDWLVATDAIGMGLNLDIGHVAFAALRKFDGRNVREVDDAELAQIAGRAGRWIQDGTFGTLTPASLPSPVVHAIEGHAFAPIRRVQWRNDDLDFASLATLRGSLAEAPKRRVFRHATQADDANALALLSAREQVATLATSEERVRLLWEVCTVPDFRKLLFEAHVAQLEEIFITLARRGDLDDDFMDEHVRDVDDVRGDVETLVARIAAARTWTYVANRASWLRAPEAWQERTRAIEDRLSDALHERLVLRFVDARRGGGTAAARPRTHRKAELRETEAPHATDPSHPFAKLAAFRTAMNPSAAPPSRAGAPAWAEEIIAAAHAELALEATGQIVHVPTKRVTGAIVRGGSIALPDVRLAEADDLGAGTKSRLLRRLLAFARDAVAEIMGDLVDLSRTHGSARVRGLVHRIEQGLGTVLAHEIDDLEGSLTTEERADLERAGLRFGAGVVYLPHGLGPGASAARVALASAAFGVRLRLPSGGAVSFVPSRSVDARAFAAIGYPVLGPRAIRADVVDRVLTRVREATEDLPASAIASWLGCPLRDVGRVLAATRAE